MRKLICISFISLVTFGMCGCSEVDLSTIDSVEDIQQIVESDEFKEGLQNLQDAIDNNGFNENTLDENRQSVAANSLILSKDGVNVDLAKSKPEDVFKTLGYGEEFNVEEGLDDYGAYNISYEGDYINTFYIEVSDTEYAFHGIFLTYSTGNVFEGEFLGVTKDSTYADLTNIFGQGTSVSSNFDNSYVWEYTYNGFPLEIFASFENDSISNLGVNIDYDLYLNKDIDALNRLGLLQTK